MSILTDWLVGDTAQTSGEAQANYDRQRRILADKIAARQAAGTLTPDQVAFYQSNQGELASTDRAAALGALEGAGEGLQTAAAGVNRTLAGSANLIFSAIPWQVWIIGGVLLFIWMGGMELLKGKLTRL